MLVNFRVMLGFCVYSISCTKCSVYLRAVVLHVSLFKIVAGNAVKIDYVILYRKNDDLKIQFQH